MSPRTYQVPYRGLFLYVYHPLPKRRNLLKCRLCLHFLGVPTDVPSCVPLCATSDVATHVSLFVSLCVPRAVPWCVSGGCSHVCADHPKVIMLRIQILPIVLNIRCTHLCTHSYCIKLFNLRPHSFENLNKLRQYLQNIFYNKLKSRYL